MPLEQCITFLLKVYKKDGRMTSALRVLTFAEVARRSSMKILSNYFAKLTGKNPRWCRFYNKAMGPLKKTPSQVNFELWALRNNQNNYNKEHQSKAPSTLTKFDTSLCISYCFWHALVAWDTNNHLLRNNNRQWLFKMFYNLNLKFDDGVQDSYCLTLT